MGRNIPDAAVAFEKLKATDTLALLGRGDEDLSSPTLIAALPGLEP